jgi:hypothetical protein
MMKDVDSLMSKMRLPTYYAEPRFHCSIAWKLEPAVGGEEEAKGLVERLEEQLGKGLRDEQVMAAKLSVHIGNETITWDLSGHQ